MADYSCYVNIVNKTNSAMNLLGSPVAKHGKYITDPPASIAAGTTIVFQIQKTEPLLTGPEGSCEYSVTDEHGVTASVAFSYLCRAILKETNSADAVVTGTAAVNIQRIPNPLPKYGHPVNVQFTVSNKK